MAYEQHVVPEPASAAFGRAYRTRRRSPLMTALQNPTVVHAIFALKAIAIDSAFILLSAIICGAFYHQAFYSGDGQPELYVKLGMTITALFVAPALLRKDYAIANFLSTKGQLRHCLTLWNTAFIIEMLLSFLTKTSSDFSRGTFLLFYVVGFCSVALGRRLLVYATMRSAVTGGSDTARILLLGSEEEVERFSTQYTPWTMGMRIVSACVLRGPNTLQEDLALASASARVLRPTDIYILVPWSQKETIDASIDAFLRVPAALHLGPERVLDRFSEVTIERMGPIASLRLVRAPLTQLETFGKRIFDIVLSAIGLILLAPVFAIVALLIKLDSPGPVFFFQRRYGFNQQPFRIVKFRSMTSMDDGRHIRQVQAGDARVTRVGRFLRKFNLDELPQLLNVLRGEMSLVGPRPHAMAHDQEYEHSISLYARRHNVKPGITGWAQVNGFRGETSTPDKMRRRVEHDLYYIDNWSFSLDLKILILTVFSRRAYQNAV